MISPVSQVGDNSDVSFAFGMTDDCEQHVEGALCIADPAPAGNIRNQLYLVLITGPASVNTNSWLTFA